MPLCGRADQWDCLVLGYGVTTTAAAHGPPATTPLLGVALRRPVPFFGTHAYCVTRRGAQILLHHAVPMDHQSDGLLVTLSDLGLLRLHLWPQSVVSQCLNDEDRQGSWHTHATTTCCPCPATPGHGGAAFGAWWLAYVAAAGALLVSLLVSGPPPDRGA